MATVWAYIKTSSVNKSEDEKKLKNLIFRIRHSKAFEITYTSQLQIKAKDWDSKNQQVKTSFDLDKQNRLDFNKKVLELKDIILSILRGMTNYDGISSEWMNKQIDRVLNPEKYAPKIEVVAPQTLFEWVEDFISNAHNRKDIKTGKLLVRNNIQQYKATYKHLKEFAKATRKKDFDFSKINLKFYNSFVEYLQGLGFTANSVGKHIRILKLMIHESPKELQERADISKFYVFTEDVDNIYLNKEELQQFKDTDFSNAPYLDRVRDWFLLLAWTGCRFSDLSKIGKTDIKDGFITFRQQKTNAKVTIPLHPVVVEILEKYNYNMPEPISNQRFNEYIKEAGEKAGLNEMESITRTVGGVTETVKHPKYELISSHTGRRSFATNMYKDKLPTIMIMSITGHKTEKSFLKYIKVEQKEHAEMMRAEWAKMYNSK